MKKRATVNWTIGKLLNIVLLVFLLVLIIYGVSTKGLNPLIDQIGNKANEVLILLNIKNDVSSKDCFSEKVSVIGGGEKLLKELEIDQNAVLNVCRNALCNISNGGLDIYRVRNGNFERFSAEGWKSYNSFFVGDIGSIKLNWEIYNKGINILEKTSVKDFYNSLFTKQFILYGDGSLWPNFPVEAIWQNDYWKISVDGGKFKIVEDDDEAIKIFVNAVNEWLDDYVRWEEGISVKPDEKYYSNINVKNSIKNAEYFGTVNTRENVEELKILFIKKKAEFLKEVEPSKEDIEELRNVVSGKSFLIGDETFIIGIEDTEDYPIITFVSNNNKFGLKYSANVKKNNEEDIPLRYYPVSLIKWDDSSWKDIGNENYYKLPEKYFKEVYQETLLAPFLESKCR